MKGENKMARDKARDDKFFNCSEEHEDNYVASLYGTNKDKVSDFLVEKCDDNTINYSTHTEVYELIKDSYGYPIPV